MNNFILIALFTLVSLEIQSQVEPNIYICDSLNDIQFDLTLKKNDTLIEVQLIKFFVNKNEVNQTDCIGRFDEAHSTLKNDLVERNQVEINDTIYVEEFQIFPNQIVLNIPTSINKFKLDKDRLLLISENSELIEFIDYDKSLNSVTDSANALFYEIRATKSMRRLNDCDYEIYFQDALFFGYASQADGFIYNKCDNVFIGLYLNDCFYKRLTKK